MSEWLFSVGAMQARALSRGEAALVQGLFEDNPGFFHDMYGHAPRPDEAEREFDDAPPGIPFTRLWVIGYFDPGQRMAGVTFAVEDFYAGQVWHVALFLVDERWRGKGEAARLYAATEAWIAGRVGRWIRLAVMHGSTRAERFWGRQGFQELRLRANVEAGERSHTMSVRAKSLRGESRDAYLQLVPRDRPEEGLPREHWSY